MKQKQRSSESDDVVSFPFAGRSKSKSSAARKGRNLRHGRLQSSLPPGLQVFKTAARSKDQSGKWVGKLIQSANPPAAVSDWVVRTFPLSQVEEIVSQISSKSRLAEGRKMAEKMQSKKNPKRQGRSTVAESVLESYGESRMAFYGEKYSK